MRFLLTLSAFLCCLANAQDTATVIKPFGSTQANASPATSAPAISVPVKTQTPVAAGTQALGNAPASMTQSTTIQAAPDKANSPGADGLDKTPNSGVRLKDLVSIEGVRTNQLIGYGLVVGLNGTGDRQQTLFSAQSLTNLLQRMGVSVSPTTITVKNTAAVLVTATLPPFAQPGTTIDATVSAIGDANNLQGGILVLTTLRAINGQVYASAQGPVVTGGFAVGRTQNSATVNHPTVGRIPNGISVERPAPSQAIGNVIRLQLKEADFTTAARVAAAVNRHFASREPVAHAENSALVSVNLPAQYSTHATEFISELERLSAEPDRIARVVVNERTGTVVLGKDVRIAPVAVMHGNLTVEIQTVYTATQPGEYSAAQPEVVPQTTVAAKDEKARNLVLKNGATVEELVKALASIGSTTRDVIAILENLRAAGALDAELDVI